MKVSLLQQGFKSITLATAKSFLRNVSSNSSSVDFSIQFKFGVFLIPCSDTLGTAKKQYIRRYRSHLMQHRNSYTAVKQNPQHAPHIISFLTSDPDCEDHS